MRAVRSALFVTSLAVSACCGGKPDGGPAPAVSAAPSAGASVAKAGPRVGEDVTVKEGSLAATYWAARGKPAMGCLLVHRWGGDRSEWTPLVPKLPDGVAVLSFDLRGQGKSPASPVKAGPKEDPKKLETEAMADDVLAAMRDLDARAGKPLVHLVVGSSAGATVAVIAAGREPRLGALGLVSPGAGIRGVDLFRPFAAVRHRPTFIASGKDDTIAQETVKTLPVMEGTRATVKAYDGNAHGADQLGRAHEALWDDLAAFATELSRSVPEPRKD